MKERPILFNGPMVRALLDGSKTQTRRVVTPTPAADQELAIVTTLSGLPYAFSHERIDSQNLRRISWGSRFGEPGDRLWVRETWTRTAVWPAAEMVIYREGDNRTDYGGPWKPGIHMFRRDSRITLEITSVRVERLQDISGADAAAEGVCGPIGAARNYGVVTEEYAIERYRVLWEQINGPDSWDKNPWVWVVEFRRLQ